MYLLNSLVPGSRHPPQLHLEAGLIDQQPGAFWSEVAEQS